MKKKGEEEEVGRWKMTSAFQFLSGNTGWARVSQPVRIQLQVTRFIQFKSIIHSLNGPPTILSMAPRLLVILKRRFHSHTILFTTKDRRLAQYFNDADSRCSLIISCWKKCFNLGVFDCQLMPTPRLNLERYNH